MSKDPSKSRIFVVGPSATGKSSCGRAIANNLGLGYVDVDDVVAQQLTMPVDLVFAERGAEFYQEANSEVLKEICTDPTYERSLIVAGAITPLSRKSREALVGSSRLIICFDASPESISERIFKSTSTSTEHAAHPLLRVKNPSRIISLLKAFRQPFFAIADIVIATDGKSLVDVCVETIAAIKEECPELVQSSMNSFDLVYSKDPSKLYYPNPSPPLRWLVESGAVKSGFALDLGCGEGRNALFLAKQGFQVVAVDISIEGAFKLHLIAEQLGLENIRCLCEDIRHFEIEPQKYDLIVASTVLDHLERAEGEKAIEKLKRGLKSGGYAYVSAFTTKDPGYLVERAGSSQGTATEQTKISETAQFVKTYFEESELKRKFSDCDIVFYKESVEEDRSHGPPHQHGIARLICRVPLP